MNSAKSTQREEDTGGGEETIDSRVLQALSVNHAPSYPSIHEQAAISSFNKANCFKCITILIFGFELSMKHPETALLVSFHFLVIGI